MMRRQTPCKAAMSDPSRLTSASDCKEVSISFMIITFSLSHSHFHSWGMSRCMGKSAVHDTLNICRHIASISAHSVQMVWSNTDHAPSNEPIDSNYMSQCWHSVWAEVSLLSKNAECRSVQRPIARVHTQRIWHAFVYSMLIIYLLMQSRHVSGRATWLYWTTSISLRPYLRLRPRVNMLRTGLPRLAQSLSWPPLLQGALM